MKKNRLIWVVIMAAFLLALQGCNPKEKKPGTVLVTPAQDTSKVIDTTIIEPGDAPIASMAKVKSDKIKKEKI